MILPITFLAVLKLHLPVALHVHVGINYALVMVAVIGLTNGMNTTAAFESGRKIAQKVDVELIGELSGPGY